VELKLRCAQLVQKKSSFFHRILYDIVHIYTERKTVFFGKACEESHAVRSDEISINLSCCTPSLVVPKDLKRIISWEGEGAVCPLGA